MSTDERFRPDDDESSALGRWRKDEHGDWYHVERLAPPCPDCGGTPCMCEDDDQ